MTKLFSFMFTEIHQLVRAMLQSIRSSYRSAPPDMQKAARQILAVAFMVIIVATVWNWGSAYYEHRELMEQLARGPVVKTARATLAPTQRSLQILGEAKPYASVTLYAKVSGYLKSVNVDKGDVVKTGQVLAVIESPETDKAYQAAVADARNKKAIAQRVNKLLERQLVSQQEADQARADSEIASAHLESQAVLKSYEVLRAPFDGTITVRYADPGALMQNATASQTSALPVVGISQITELRVYVYLDQRDASFVAKGQPAEISLTERPDLQMSGHVERISGELDEKTRMLLTEIDLDNGKEEIVAGSLVQVTLHLNTPPGLQVPTEAVVLKGTKTMVPVIDDQDRVHYTEVKVIDSDGKQAKIQTGLKEGDVVALNLGNTLPDDSKVQPLKDPPPTAAAKGEGK